MRFGILRNIAGNYRALTSAHRLLEAIGVDLKICLGPVVGIYPFINECVGFLREHGYKIITRPEDEEFAGECRFEGWSTAHLVDALKYARTLVSSDTIEFLRGLPSRDAVGELGLESRAPGYGGLIYEVDQARAAFITWHSPIVVHAASFDPYIWTENLTCTGLGLGMTRLPSGRVLVSTGSLGSLYHGCSDLRVPVVMVLDSCNRSVQLSRIASDVCSDLEDLSRTAYPPNVLSALRRIEGLFWRVQ